MEKRLHEMEKALMVDKMSERTEVTQNHGIIEDLMRQVAMLTITTETLEKALVNRNAIIAEKDAEASTKLVETICIIYPARLAITTWMGQVSTLAKI